MILKRLCISGYRNVESAELELSPTLNCLVGDNGAGKTNVLDAVHYLSMCRSSLGGTDRQSVRHGAEFFVIEGDYEADAGHGLRVMCSFSGSTGKKVKSGGKEHERLSDHVGSVPLVIISPADTFLISDAADERRRWLNSFISQLDRAYLQSLVRYNSVLAERNKVLRDGIDSELLDVLDMQLAAHGDAINARRQTIVDQMRPLVADYYARLADDREAVEMSYRSDATAEGMAAVLAASRQKDLVNGFSSAGVHRDDILMKIGGDTLRRYGSQGQQKSFLVALKLAQFAVVREATGERPILLLDDLFDKLDTGRVGRLIELVEGNDFGQIFISDCNRARLESVLGIRARKLFEVRDGVVDGE